MGFLAEQFNPGDFVPYGAGIAFFVVVLRAMVWVVAQTRLSAEDQMAQVRAERLRADSYQKRVTELEETVSELRNELSQVRADYDILLTELARVKTAISNQHPVVRFD